MQTIQSMPTMSYSRIETGSLPIARIIGSIIGGAIMTFVLFAVMQALIEQDNARPIIDPPITIVSSILDIEETKTIRQVKIKPPPEIKKQPKTPARVSPEPISEGVFSTVISIPNVPTEKVDFAVGNVDQQPRPVVRINPQYPGPAASAGIEGFVTLSFAVTASGEVTDIVIVESQPKRTFDKAAKQALRKWKYQPKMVSGSAVGMDGLQVRLDFTLANN